MLGGWVGGWLVGSIFPGTWLIMLPEAGFLNKSIGPKQAVCRQVHGDLSTDSIDLSIGQTDRFLRTGCMLTCPFYMQAVSRHVHWKLLPLSRTVQS